MSEKTPDALEALRQARSMLATAHRAYGEPGSRDVAVSAWNAKIDATVAVIDAALATAEAARPAATKD